MPNKIEDLVTETEEIIEETQRESIINRPYNLAGSIKKVQKERFNITEESITYGKGTVVPALMKLFMESLDNPIDVAIKGGCDSIDIKVDSKSITIKDNGYGVSTEVDDAGESVLYKAFCKYNTSSNYKEKKGKGQKGINGIGIKLCTTLSTIFIVTSEDANSRVRLTATENNLHHKSKSLKQTGKTGIELYFEPDFNIFEVNEIDSAHIDRMYEYTLMQALTYPNIKFRFNGKIVKMRPRQFLKMLHEDAVIEEHDNYFFGVVPNVSGEFKQLSYINGLEIANGGTHVDVVLDSVVRNLRERLSKRFKSIKPGDIKSKLTFILIGKNMQNIDWEGQVKDKIASTQANIREYFRETDLDKFSLKVFRNKNIVDNIIDYFKIAEEFKKQQEMKKLDKVKKKIKSEKYTRAVGTNEILIICEGRSASSAIMPILGREGIAYYELKGKPLNTMTASQSKFTANKELSELYTIIKQEGFTKIVIGADNDLDGIAICGLTALFCYKYTPEVLDNKMLYILRTPIGVSTKNRKITDWVYDIQKMDDLKGEVSYKKGLGSWKVQDLKFIIEKDGIEKMFEPLEYFGSTEEDKESFEEWYSDTNADKRKEFIMNNDFELIKL